jgi:hypothetical protein
MPNPFRRPVFAGPGLLLPALLLCLLTLSASQAIAQDDAPVPETKFQKQLDRIDLAVSAAGSIGTSVSGIEQRDINTSHSMLTIKPSSTVGELVTLRYTAKSYVGFEFNFGNLRYTENYTYVPPPSQSLPFTGAQTGARELTLGYVAHTPKIFGVQPYLGAGGGTIGFKPTTGGGLGLPQQYRAAYYYSLGLEDNFPGSHFGARVGFRQLIFLAPDFQQNYLTITRRTSTYEPTIGFFLRF